MPEIFPIAGATTIERVNENAGAAELTKEEITGTQGILDSCEVGGDRYHAVEMTMVNG